MFTKKKNLLLLVSLIIIPLCSPAQSNYTAMILSLRGEGVILRDAQEEKIEVPQRFIPGDELSIKSGNAIIMLFSGQEIPLSAVSYFTIPKEDNTSRSQIAELANNSNADQSLLAQSGVAFRIRGKSNVFPRSSKILSKENIVLRIAYENPKKLNLGLKLIDSQTQKVIFEADNISDSLVSLAEAPFIEGRSYYWTLSNTPNGRPELGTIIVPENIESGKPAQADLPKTNFEYINAISAHYNNKFYFDAYALINEAKQKFPDVTIYNLLLENILTE